MWNDDPMIPVDSLSRSSRFYVLTRIGSEHLHARECHFNRFNLKKGTCSVSDYGFMRIKLSFDSTIETISQKAFATREEAHQEISQLMKSRE
jgi:hypothetical protein